MTIKPVKFGSTNNIPAEFQSGDIIDTTFVAASGAPSPWSSDFRHRAEIVPATAIATTYSVIGTSLTIASSGAATTATDSDGVLIQQSSAAGTAGSLGGWNLNVFDLVTAQQSPQMQFKIKPNSTTVIAIRAGLYSASPGSSATPAVKLAECSWIAGTDTNYQLRTCDGTTTNAVDTGIAPVSGTMIVGMLVFNGSSSVDLWINGSKVASSALNLPGATQSLGPLMGGFSLTTAAVTNKIGGCIITYK